MVSILDSGFREKGMLSICQMIQKITNNSTKKIGATPLF